MKKTHKRLLGVFGLLLVAAMTLVAVHLPSPEAKATNITDTVSVRVVGSQAELAFTAPENGLITNDPAQTVKFTYANVETMKLELAYTNYAGDTTTYPLMTETPDYASGEGEAPMNLAQFGYGKFVFTLKGYDFNDLKNGEDSTLIEYVPTEVELSGNGKDNSITVDLDYDADKTDKVVVDVYKGDGTKVEYTVTVYPPTKQVVIPGSVIEGLGTGDYKIVVTTYENNVAVYESTIEYTIRELVNTGAPNTGGLFQDVNIAKEDYLVTGLLIFFVFAVVAFGIVAKSRKSKMHSKRRK